LVGLNRVPVLTGLDSRPCEARTQPKKEKVLDKTKMRYIQKKVEEM